MSDNIVDEYATHTKSVQYLLRYIIIMIIFNKFSYILFT